jgi:Flp pilus assembly pilin Flp
MKEKIKAFLKDERGDFGIKQIAITLGVILIVGASITVINGKMGTWLNDIWTIFKGALEKLAETP